MSNVYEKSTVYETPFEGGTYVAFISIHCCNYRLSLISERGTMYSKLEVQK